MEDLKRDLPKSHLKIRRFLDLLNLTIDVIAGLSILVLVVIVLIQIIGRYIGNPAPWTEEATRFVFIWVIFLGIAMGFRKSESARVTIGVKYLPSKFRNITKYLYIVASYGFFIFMAYQGYKLVLQQKTMREMGSALHIPMWIVGLALPISGILGIIAVTESILFNTSALEIEGRD